jgi:hypothetical protein
MKNLFSAFLNLDLSVLSFTRLTGNALKILIHEYLTPFLMQDKATNGLCNWSSLYNELVN